MLLRWLTAPVLLIAMLGCEGRTTTDIMPWRCNDSSSQCPMTVQPAGLAGFWRFDEGQLGGDWQSDAPAPSWVDCGEQGGVWATGSWSGVCGSERLGGTGASLRLAGQGYVAAALPDSLANSPVTLAAWISLPRASTIPRSSVLAVVRPACQSAYLDVLTDGTNRSLVLAVERPGATGDACEVEEITARLPSGFLDWGLGNWYHVAGVVDGEERALYVDGEVAASSVAAGDPTTPAEAGVVHIGASAAGQDLNGMIDDVALFSRSVAAEELSTFALQSTSVLSDGQHWIPWSADGSSASWKSDCRNPEDERSDQGAAVAVDNGYWSAGGLLARTPSGRRIGSLKKAILVADIPKGEGFDFVLGSRHNSERCTWHVSGTGKSRYEFDLADVSHCDCPSTCDCAFEVAEARIGSRWDKSTDLAFSVCGVEFEWGPESDPIVELGPGGMRGLNGWCWRPISYHEAAFADLDETLTDGEQTVGMVRGGNDQSALLAADFVLGESGEERAYCDLSNVSTIRLTADMPHGFAYEFRIADFYGVAREWSDQWDRDQPTREFRLCDEDDELADDVELCGREEDPIRYRGNNVNLERVRYLGVQKGYETAADDTTITITDVTFESEGSAAKNCVVSASSGGAGPE